MNKVSIVICVRNSFPWLRVTLNALHNFHAGVAFKVIPVIHPSDQEAVTYFKNSPHQSVVYNLETGDEVAHGSQLELGMLHVDTEYTLWLDSDCFPVREWWLYELLAYDCDLVGAKANYDYPAASPLCCLFKTNLYKEYLARCPNRLNWTKIGDKVFDIGRYFTHLICRERNTHLIPITNNSYGLEDLGFCMHARWGSMRQIRNDKGNLDLKVQERRDEVLNNVNWLKRLNQKSWWEYENRNRW